MNAYELADELDRIVKVSMPLHYITESANMLRQQADRIVELEKETHSINYTCPNCETYVELFYKTPQIKELSDEEIEKLQAEHTEKGHFADTLNVKDFAKAILKKASEK